MTHTANPAEIREFMSGHFREVFSTMLSLDSVPRTEPTPPDGDHRVTGVVGMAGEELDGVLYLHLADDFARRATAAMLGMAPDEISGETEVNDVVGELTNMVAGGLKSHLNDLGAGCDMSTPGIIRGKDFSVDSVPDAVREYLSFDCDNSHVVVEFHIHSKRKLS